MTRCYGWSIPYTYLIPFADCMNHHKESTDHYIINSEYEKNNYNKSYIIKKNNLNLSILPELRTHYDYDLKKKIK